MKTTENAPSPAVLAIVAAPAVAVTLAVVVFSAMEVSGRTPFSDGPVRNVAEAAGMGIPSEVLRLLAAGEDPHRIWDVRPEIISSTITRVTALEAAIWSRRSQLVALLDSKGLIVGDETRRHLTCLANDLPVEEIVAYLSPGGPPDCVPGQALTIVLDRSRHQDAD